MTSIIEIHQASNLLLIFAPIILMIFSGYTCGSIISRIRGINSQFPRDLIYGNTAICFIFLAGFIISGVLSFKINQYFTVFTYSVFAISILGLFLWIKKMRINDTTESANQSRSKIQEIKESLFRFSESPSTLSFFFGTAIFVTLLVYCAVIVYSHPVFSEYDSLYLFLPIAKSILLGNSPYHDHYLGSDVNMAYPPFNQAVNSWIIHSFEYSSLRMFPIYFIFLSAVFVYSFAKNILSKISNNNESSLLGLLASSAFLITPALLVVSSRFTLQQDIPFIFVLVASFYFLSDIIRVPKASRTSLLMLSISLALMTLTREIGIVISIAIFFLVPAIKFTNKNVKLRGTFSILSFLPLHLYYFIFYGHVEIISGLVLIVCNILVFYIVSRLENQNAFSSLLRPASNVLYITPFIIPSIFILTNVIIFNGVYPGIVLSDRYYEMVDIDVSLFAKAGHGQQDELDELKSIPRIDVLFISVAMGSIVIFFKLIGFGNLVRRFKNNYEYSLLLILVILLLATWSFLLESGFEISNIRHVLYFTPLLSVILVIGLTSGNKSEYWKLYYYGIIVFISIYFIEYNLIFLNSNNFVGLFIDPFKNSIITIFDLLIGFLITLPLIISKIFPTLFHKSRQKVDRPPANTFVVIIFSILLVILIYYLGSNGAFWISLQTDPNRSPPGWENNVFEPIGYLNTAEPGNVLSIRAPAIPFFTNRTNFDLFNFQTFAYEISELLSTNSSKTLKNNLLEKGIKYVVLPNEKNNLYYVLENLTKRYPVLETIRTDKDFERVNLAHFNLYKYTRSSNGSINLIDKGHVWRPFGQTTVVQNVHSMILAAGTDRNDTIYNRAYLQTEIKLADKPLLLSVEHQVETKIGKASYSIEIRDIKDNDIVFNGLLNSTTTRSSTETFLLPANLVDKPVEFRIYIVTDGPGQHSISIKKVSIMYT